jgi:SnoaL-like domain
LSAQFRIIVPRDTHCLLLGWLDPPPSPSRTILTSNVIDRRRAAELVLLASSEAMLSMRLPAIGASAEHDDRENAMDRRNVLKAAFTVGAGLSPTSSKVGAAAEHVSERRIPMSNVNEVVVRYLKAWSERDPNWRRDLVAQTFTEDGAYIDRVHKGRGHDGVDAMIAKAQAQFPGYSLDLASGIEAHHNYVRFGWWPAARRKRRSTSREQTSPLLPTFTDAAPHP